MNRPEAENDPGREDKLIPEAPKPAHASFVQRLKQRFGRPVVPEVSLQAETDIGESERGSTESTGLFVRLSEKDPSAARYRVKGELARGGMGAIMRVWDDDLRRNLAMKVLLPRRGAAEQEEQGSPQVDAELLSRFLEEAQITGQLDHPGIVPVHDLGLDESGRVYFTMRLVRGRDLKAILSLLTRGEEGWSVTKALHVALKVCEAMAFAHSKGVVHRDLKPANIMVGRFGETYVMDWGLARVLGRDDSHDLRLKPVTDSTMSLVKTARQDDHDSNPDSPLITMDGDVVGTPSYMAPEQAQGRLDLVGPRSDVYSLGSILYQVLTGRAPYVDDEAKLSPHTVLARVLEGPPEPIDKIARGVPEELVAICEKAMQRDPEARYGGMMEVGADIEAFLEGRVVGAYETGPVAEARKWIQRNKGMANAIGVATLLAFGGTAGVIAVQVTKAAELEAANENLNLAKTRAEDKEDLANEATLKARDSADEARTARDEADEKALEAGKSAAEARRRSYMSNIRSAEYSLRLREVGEAGSSLELCDEDLRAWEWHHLRLRSQSQLGDVVSLTTPVREVILDEQGSRVLVLTANGMIHGLEVGTEGLDEKDATSAWAWSLDLPLHAGMDLSPHAGAMAVIGREHDKVVLLERTWLADPDWGGAAVLAPDEIDAGDGGRLPPRGMIIPETIEAGGRIAAATKARFGPVDDLLAVGYANGVVLVWDHAARELVHVLVGQSGSVTDLAWSPGGELLATSSAEGDVRVWDSRGGLALQVLSGHESGVLAVAFSPDGGRVVTGAEDGRVRLFDARTGRLLGRHDAHGSSVRALAYQPGGALIASGADDATVQVWDPEIDETRSYFGHEDAIRSLSFAFGGSMLLSGGQDGSVRIWDPTVGGAFTDLIDDRSVLGSTPLTYVTAVDFHPGGVLGLTGHSDGSIAIWDTWSGELLDVLRGHKYVVSTAVWGADGETILSASIDKTAILWDVNSGGPKKVFGPHRNWVRAAVLSSDGSRAVTASGDQTARIWDTATGDELFSLEGDGGWVNAVAFTAGEDQVWTGSSDGGLRLWSCESGELVKSLQLSAEIRRLHLAAGGELLAAGLGDGMCVIIDVNSGDQLFARDCTGGEGDPVTAMALGRDGTRLIVGAMDGLLRIFEVRSGDQLLTLRGHTGEITGIAFSAADGRLLTGSDASPAAVSGTRFVGPGEHVARVWETGQLLERRNKRRYAGELQVSAAPIVKNLYSTQFFEQKVMARLAQLPMRSDVRQAALRLVRLRGEDAVQLAAESWLTALSSDREAAQYMLALARAEAAVAIEPANRSCMVVLGAAQYRRGLHPAAIRSLDDAEALEDGGDMEFQVTLCCFSAMAHQRLGHEDEARSYLAKLDNLLVSPASVFLALGPEELGNLIEETRELLVVEPLSEN